MLIHMYFWTTLKLKHKFVDLDGVYSHHHNKTEGAKLVLRAGTMKRICGEVLLVYYTDHTNIDFTAKEIMEKLTIRNTKYTILRFVTTGVEDPSQHLNDNVFDLNKLLSIQVFQDMDILEALLTCKGSFTKLHLLSLLSFSTDRQCSRKKYSVSRTCVTYLYVRYGRTVNANLDLLRRSSLRRTST